MAASIYPARSIIPALSRNQVKFCRRHKPQEISLNALSAPGGRIS